MLGSSAVRGLTSLFVGFFLGMIGIDLQTGQPRFTFGVSELLDGTSMIVAPSASSPSSETLYVASRRYAGRDEIVPLKGSLYMTAQEWARSWKAWLRGAAIGFPIGALPAGGAEIPTFLSYALEEALKHKEEFGTTGDRGRRRTGGGEQRLCGRGAGRMLTLGLPTSATAAIMLSAFQSYGINPGPLLLQTQPGLVWGLVASLFVANVLFGHSQFAADRTLGTAFENPGSAALRRHSRLCDGRHIWHFAISDSTSSYLCSRRHGLPDAALRFSDSAGDHRHDPWSAGRDFSSAAR